MEIERLRQHMKIAEPIAREAIRELGKKLVIVTYNNFGAMNVGVLTNDREHEDPGIHKLDELEIARVLSFVQEAGYRIVKEEDIPF